MIITTPLVEQQRQHEEFRKDEVFYRISIVLKHKNQGILLNTSDTKFILSASQLWHKSSIDNISRIPNNANSRGGGNISLHANTVLVIPYILVRGVYRIQFHVCDEYTTQDKTINNSDIR